MLNVSKKILMTIMLTLGMASYSYADVVLDDFTYNPDISIEVNAGSTAATAQRNDINVFGGDVVYDLDYVAGGLDSSAVTFGTGVMAFSNDATMFSTLLITYSEINNGPLALDFSSFGGFYYDLISSDLGFSILVTIGSGNGADTSTYAVNSGAINALTRTNVLFSSFMGSADLAAVDYVSILLSSNDAAVDLVLTEFGVTTNVPEPASLAIFGLGLIGLAFGARKKV